eukprot:6955656-Prymnesium_polylepis.1
MIGGSMCGGRYEPSSGRAAAAAPHHCCIDVFRRVRVSAAPTARRARPKVITGLPPAAAYMPRRVCC